jgi:hypothetical protein
MKYRLYSATLLDHHLVWEHCRTCWEPGHIDQDCDWLREAGREPEFYFRQVLEFVLSSTASTLTLGPTHYIYNFTDFFPQCLSVNVCNIPLSEPVKIKLSLA